MTHPTLHPTPTDRTVTFARITLGRFESLLRRVFCRKISITKNQKKTCTREAKQQLDSTAASSHYLPLILAPSSARRSGHPRRSRRGGAAPASVELVSVSRRSASPSRPFFCTAWICGGPSFEIAAAQATQAQRPKLPKGLSGGGGCFSPARGRRRRRQIRPW